MWRRGRALTGTGSLSRRIRACARPGRARSSPGTRGGSCGPGPGGAADVRTGLALPAGGAGPAAAAGRAGTAGGGLGDGRGRGRRGPGSGRPGPPRSAGPGLWAAGRARRGCRNSPGQARPVPGGDGAEQPGQSRRGPGGCRGCPGGSQHRPAAARAGQGRAGAAAPLAEGTDSSRAKGLLTAGPRPASSRNRKLALIRAGGGGWGYIWTLRFLHSAPSAESKVTGSCGLCSMAGSGVSTLSIYTDCRISPLLAQLHWSKLLLWLQAAGRNTWFGLKCVFPTNQLGLRTRETFGYPTLYSVQKTVVLESEGNSSSPLLHLLLTRVQFRVLLLLDFSHQNIFIPIRYKLIYLRLTHIFHGLV